LFIRRSDSEESAPKDRLVIQCNPALVAVLLRKEKDKGSPLTQQEVLEIRDKASAVAVPYDLRHIFEESRGYADIDPENAWEEWQSVRGTLLAINQ
jgi:hypothetical protein